MKIFIAQPDLYLKDITFESIDKKKACLSRQGHTPVAPQDNYFGKNPTFADEMGQIVTMLFNCEAVLFCKDWETSFKCTVIHDIVMRSKSFAAIGEAKDFKVIFEQ